MKIFILIVFFSFFTNCKNVNNDYDLKESGTYKVKSDDLEMISTIEKARNSFADFVVAFKSGSTNYDNFSIKVPLKTNDNSLEHIWLSKIEIVNNEYYGIIDNLPVNIKDRYIGSRLKINPNTISDWMYLENGKLRGGYTILLWRSYLSVAERKEFDKECGFIIE